MEKTNAKDYLGKEVLVKIDRQLGSRHPIIRLTFTVSVL